MTPGVTRPRPREPPEPHGRRLDTRAPRKRLTQGFCPVASGAHSQDDGSIGGRLPPGRQFTRDAGETTNRVPTHTGPPMPRSGTSTPPAARYRTTRQAPTRWHRCGERSDDAARLAPRSKTGLGVDPLTTRARPTITVAHTLSAAARCSRSTPARRAGYIEHHDINITIRVHPACRFAIPVHTRSTGACACCICCSPPVTCLSRGTERGTESAGIRGIPPRRSPTQLAQASSTHQGRRTLTRTTRQPSVAPWAESAATGRPTAPRTNRSPGGATVDEDQRTL